MGFGHLTWICLYFHLVKTSIPRGVCMRNIDGSTFSEAYCCQHHFNESGRCQECPNGFTSIDGIPCFPCLNGTYGIRCKYKCSCNTGERCHHKNGCVNIEDDNTDYVNDTSTVHLNRIHSSATYYLDLQTSPKAHVKDDDKENQFGTLLIYIICSAGLLLLIGLSALIHRYKPNVTCIETPLKTESEIVTTRNDANDSIPEIAVNENVYDIIEEDMLETLNT